MTGFFCFSAIGLLVLLQGAIPSVYVDPDGNDANSGSNTEPLASIQVALDKAASLPVEYASVILKDGTYSIAEPLSFTSKHSGITLKAEHPGAASISGGQIIGGWRQESNGLWSADVPNGIFFKQLFINGDRKPRARSPNDGYYFAERPYNSSKVKDKSYDLNKDRFYFREGQFDGVLASEVSNTYVTVFHSWATSLHAVERLDQATKLVYLASPAKWPIGYWESNFRFIIENYRAALDSPGEWYLDMQIGKVYYFPEDDENISKLEATVPVTACLLYFEGTEALPVGNVSVEGIIFEYCDWSLPRNNAADGQLHRDLRSYAVYGNYLHDSSIAECVFRRFGADGIWLEKGCRNLLIQKNQFYDLGGSALKIGTQADPAPESATTRRIKVDNNLIRNCGVIFHGSCGVGVFKSPDNTISHNEIFDLDYTAISVGWEWRDVPSLATNNMVEYNRMYRLGRDVLSDLSGIYMLGRSQDSVIRNNIIHDVTVHLYGGWGLYADAYGCDMLFENNLVYRTESTGLMRNQGHNNIAKNNIIAFCNGFFQSGRAVTNTPSPVFNIEHNISYCNGTNTLVYAADHWVQMDSNLYWNLPQTNILFGTKTFSQWQLTGHDQNSQFADPLFTDPSGNDFTLPASSPSFSMGFTPIDYDAVGLYGD